MMAKYIQPKSYMFTEQSLPRPSSRFEKNALKLHTCGCNHSFMCSRYHLEMSRGQSSRNGGKRHHISCANDVSWNCGNGDVEHIVMKLRVEGV